MHVVGFLLRCCHKCIGCSHCFLNMSLKTRYICRSFFNLWFDKQHKNNLALLSFPRFHSGNDCMKQKKHLSQPGLNYSWKQQLAIFFVFFCTQYELHGWSTISTASLMLFKSSSKSLSIWPLSLSSSLSEISDNYSSLERSCIRITAGFSAVKCVYRLFSVFFSLCLCRHLFHEGNRIYCQTKY